MAPNAGTIPAWKRRPINMPTRITITATIRFRITSENVRPASTAERAIGSDLNRSMMPACRSSVSPTLVLVEPKTEVCTRMQVIRKSM